MDSLVYRGPGWLGSEWRQVMCWCGPAGYLLEIDAVGGFTVIPDGATVLLDRVEPRADWQAVREVALGPALILALALQDTWCLHASAAVLHDRAIAFLGESGKGKSTLAAFLGAGAGAVWRLLADDVLPVRLGPDGLEALPHFPQLKLSPEEQPSLGMPEQLPLDAVYLLEKPPTNQGGVDSRPLGPRDAMLALVRHTVAARLFDRRLLARHMRFCAQTAACIPVRRLSYPHEYALLPRVGDALAADLQTPGGGRWSPHSVADGADTEGEQG